MSDAENGMLERLLGKGIIEVLPANVAVINREFTVVAANGNFERYFAEWRGRKCYEVYRSRSQPCQDCQAIATFCDGKVRVADSPEINRQGRPCHYVTHLAPIRDEDGVVRFVMEMSTDLTEPQRWQREYDLLFDRVPCYITIIDRDFRIIRANDKFRRTFGETHGEFCYQIYKRRMTPCARCPASLTFTDGGEHRFQQRGVRRDGSIVNYVVTTSPLSRGDDGVAHVIEMATDITEVKQLENQLHQAHDLYESLIHNSAQGIVSFDKSGRTLSLNPAARDLFDWKSKRMPPQKSLSRLLPEEFITSKQSDKDVTDFEDVTAHNMKGDPISVRLRVVKLKSRGRALGWAAFLRDLRIRKQLEHDKLEAERLAAVGQTVAGLAHSIKNMLMGLEGGMYMVDTGLHSGDAQRIVSGWDTLQRNFEKTTALVKDFLSFAKGRLPELRPTDPNKLAADIVELYRETARRQGVELIMDKGEGIAPAPLDPEGIETCLTNLISNAMDAVILHGRPDGKVVLRTRQEGDDLIFEVNDNGCGMDWEVKQKVFTTFFTTKGNQGTGLGLLTTRKIVQEHGGRIDVESAPETETTFRIRLPRSRLNSLANRT